MKEENNDYVVISEDELYERIKQYALEDEDDIREVITNDWDQPLGDFNDQEGIAWIRGILCATEEIAKKYHIDKEELQMVQDGFRGWIDIAIEYRWENREDPGGLEALITLEDKYC